MNIAKTGPMMLALASFSASAVAGPYINPWTISPKIPSLHTNQDGKGKDRSMPLPDGLDLGSLDQRGTDSLLDTVVLTTPTPSKPNMDWTLAEHGVDPSLDAAFWMSKAESMVPSAGSSASPVPAPVPAPGALMVLGLAGLATRRRRR